MSTNFIEKAYQESILMAKKIEGISINWNDFSDKEFIKIPLLEKNEIVRRISDFIPPYYAWKLRQGQLLNINTSGSTGKYMEVYWDINDYRRSMFPLWFLRQKIYGVHTWDKRCRFYATPILGQNDNYKRYVNNGLEFNKSNLNEEMLKKIYYDMLDYQPIWLLLQPCIAELLCNVKNKYNLPNIKSLKYIEMTGELLTVQLKNMIKGTFLCAVANQYGMNEVNSIAFECDKGNLHCMEDNVYVEILDDKGCILPDGVEGNIYVTTKHNRVMPFIRYGTGDCGKILTSKCDCGCGGKILCLSVGRKNDWVITTEYNKISADVFIRAIEYINQGWDNCILQYQIVQEDYDLFIVKLVLSEKIEDIEKVFINQIGDERIKQANFKFEFFQALLPEKTGKRKFFVSKVKEWRN